MKVKFRLHRSPTVIIEGEITVTGELADKHKNEKYARIEKLTHETLDQLGHVEILEIST